MTITGCAVYGHAHTLGDVAKETHTKVRSMRAAKDVWEPFEENVGTRNRSAWLVDFITWVNAHPDVWKLARERHGDELGEALAQFLAWYEREPGAKLPRRPIDQG